MSNVIEFISGVFKPVTELIGDMHTSKEEEMTLNNALVGLQNSITSQTLDLERQLLSSQTSIITAEANGQSWLQRNWRPITMLTFLVLVVCDSFGLLAFRLAAEAWTLLQIGLGGYVVGRSAEKIAPSIIKAVSK